MKDSIDFANQPVDQLFRQMFIPTLVAMVSIVILNIIDGAFVGHGAGSDALAAVNIIAPLYMIMGGISMMFGIGGSVVASIHLSQGKVKAACLNITQSLIACFLLTSVLGGIILCYQEQTAMIFGSSTSLLPLAVCYLKWLALFSPLIVLGHTLIFVMRLDGSPRLAMYTNLLAVILNIIGDYALIFGVELEVSGYHISVPRMGLEGASLATCASSSMDAVIGMAYLLFFSKNIRLTRMRMTLMSLRLSLRNLAYQIRVGGSAFMSEMAVLAMFVIGNYQFMRYMGEDGVAAFSIGCYMTPICIMFGNAIVQSSQPIISFAHGQQNRQRVMTAFRIDMQTGILCGIAGSLFIWFCSGWIANAFLPSDCAAWELANHGLPYFGTSFLLIITNIVITGFFQSTEQNVFAMLYTVLKGLVILLPTYIFLPMLAGNDGLWFCQSACEVIALFLLLLYRHVYPSTFVD